MRRRDALRAGGVLAAAVALGGCSGRDSAGDEGRPYEPLGSVDVEGAAEAVVGDDGETAYVAATDGFATVDVSDPADPRIMAEVRNLLGADEPPLLDVLDVKVSGDRLVVPGPANPDSGAFNGFLCYDVSDPADPEPIAHPFETGHHIHNCFLDGDLLYVVANDGEENPLVIYDVGGDAAEEIGRWSLLDREPEWADVHWLLWYLHDVFVSDDLAVLAHWDAGTYLLDVSDPVEPQYVSHVRDPDVSLDDLRAIDRDDMAAVNDAQLALPGNDHYAAVDDTGEILAVSRESWAPEAGTAAGAGGIDLYDVADAADPTHLATIEAAEPDDASYYGGTWTTAHNFELRDDHLYASWYQAGVTIHDVADPADPDRLAAWLDPETAGFFTAQVARPGETLVASSTPIIPNTDLDGALYTFPIREGEQPDPPPLDGGDEDE